MSLETKLKCSKDVWGKWHNHKCSRIVWKDGYCKQHHPDSEKLRQQKSIDNYNKKFAYSPQGRLLKALDRIKELEQEVALLRLEGKS